MPSVSEGVSATIHDVFNATQFGDTEFDDGSFGNLKLGTSNDANAGVPGWHFSSVGVPQGASITSATFNIQVVFDDYYLPIPIFYAADTDNASVWSDPNYGPFQIQKGGNSKQSTAALSGETWTVGVTSLIQEVISRTGWQSNNNINLIATYGGGSEDVDLQDYANGTGAGTLDITYSAETQQITVPVPVESLTSTDPNPSIDAPVNASTPVEQMSANHPNPVINASPAVAGLPTELLSAFDPDPLIDAPAPSVSFVEVLTLSDNNPSMSAPTVVQSPDDQLTAKDREMSVDASSFSASIPTEDASASIPEPGINAPGSAELPERTVAILTDDISVSGQASVDAGPEFLSPSIPGPSLASPSVVPVSSEVINLAKNNPDVSSPAITDVDSITVTVENQMISISNKQPIAVSVPEEVFELTQKTPSIIIDPVTVLASQETITVDDRPPGINAVVQVDVSSGGLITNLEKPEIILSAGRRVSRTGRNSVDILSSGTNTVELLRTGRNSVDILTNPSNEVN